MRKFAVLALALLVLILLVSCKNGNGDDTSDSSSSYTIETSTSPGEETSTEPATSEPTETSEPAETTAPDTQDPSSIIFTPVDQTVYVTGENVNVRSAPSVTGDIIAVLHYGDDIRCVGTSEKWYKIIYADKECYISSDYVTFDNISGNDFEAVNDTVYVTTDYVNLRRGPSTATEIMANLTKGASLTRIGRNAEWSKVLYNGNQYYIHNSTISTEPSN
ncbi:MAG: SH3 domain-containing protein [Eubacteriales bacterium]|jgi:uncharacterized protein YgiM (DUF1202 family)